MKRWILLLSLALLVLPAAAQIETPYPSYIQTQGRAEREITPDRFWLAITVNERESKGKITVEEQQQAMIAALRELGIDTEKQLRMADLTSEFYRKNAAVATARYQLELHSAADVARVYTALDRIGIPNVRIERVSHSQLEQYKDEVRIEAIRDARRNAATLAEAIGQQIGPCFYIYDSNSDILPRYASNTVLMRAKTAMDSESAAIEAEPALDFRTIRLEYNVQAKFVLKE